MTKIMCIAAALALAGCSKKEPKQKEDPAAKQQTGQSNWTTPHPGAQGSPHADMPSNPHADMPSNPHAGMPGNPHAGMPANPHGGMPGAAGVDVTQMGLPSPDPNRKIDHSKFLAGNISVAKALKAKVNPGDVLFVSVKRKDPKTGKAMGAPIAVERLVVSTFPISFRLSEANAMVGGTSFSGDVVITVWKDDDQDALSKAPGEPIGSSAATIPQDDIAIALDKVR